MTIAAVIAEYNPFHNGHAYQLREIRRQTGADLILVMMSGDFVQRGAPACTDKYTRCRMALAAGADMVCELPVYGALGSAEIFAESAVSLLNQLGCIDFLCFGAETIDPHLFHAIVSVLSDEPPEYRTLLQDALKTGMNFPAARSYALGRLLKNTHCSHILNLPNNILAIEYMKALRKTGSPIKPIAIRRTGAGYHSMETTAGFQSATAIRHQLSDGTLNPSECIAGLDIPDTSKVLLQSYLTHRPILTSNDFSDVLAAQLLDVHTDLTEYVDISSDLANRIDSFRYQFLSTEQFITLLSARNLTSTRLPGVPSISFWTTGAIIWTWRNHQYAGFILGFRKQSERSEILQPSVRAQLITQTSQAYDHLTGIGLDIYNATFTHHDLSPDSEMPLTVISS